MKFYLVLAVTLWMAATQVFACGANTTASAPQAVASDASVYKMRCGPRKEDVEAILALRAAHASLLEQVEICRKKGYVTDKERVIVELLLPIVTVADATKMAGEYAKLCASSK